MIVCDVCKDVEKDAKNIILQWHEADGNDGLVGEKFDLCDPCIINLLFSTIKELVPQDNVRDKLLVKKITEKLEEKPK